jgi:hypothetical protein
MAKITFDGGKSSSVGRTDITLPQRESSAKGANLNSVLPTPRQSEAAIGRLTLAARPVGSQPSLPTASRPSPSQLKNNFYGQQSPQSANQTGKIHNAAQLAQFVFAGYNGGAHGPVSIAPATLRQGDETKSAYLVGISGTEAVKDQSTGWITNLKAGFQLSNPGLRNAREAIFNTVPKGSNLALAGHSQGGMIAQQLAADPEIKKHYNVINTVTFGSPLISLGQREGEVRRIAAAGDPVPRLSAQSALPGFSTWALAGQQNIPTDFPITPTNLGNGITAHNSDYLSEFHKENLQMDALGRQNPKTRTSIEFDPNQRVFFTSPTNSAAK